MAQLTQRQVSLFPEMAKPLDKRLALREDILRFPPKEVNCVGHIVRMLAQFGLPHDNPGDETTAYSRTNGNLTFQITSVVKDGGIPWGNLPRLILAYASSQACYTKSPVIHLGDNLSCFLKEELGMAVTGGQNGTIRRIKDQTYRLFTSNISINNKQEIFNDRTGEKKGTRRMVGIMNIAQALDVWEPHKDKDRDSLWYSRIQFNQDFYNALISAPIPVDFRIIRGIQQSPLALDLYFFLTYRMNTLERPISIPYFGNGGLHEQVGSSYQDNKTGRQSFKRAVEKQLANIRFFWPDLQVMQSADNQSLDLRPSRTSVQALR